ncbi:uncharacterized protein M6B38_218650 [Iris pallida]|uniref:CBM20 domain-containing protein n=1 Tax=Iris pallida TaxID=29817 RepID=A0AAX6DXP2_IRIPA|nr:uncharacterized protein M6B38_218650 [Iris pallida]
MEAQALKTHCSPTSFLPKTSLSGRRRRRTTTTTTSSSFPFKAAAGSDSWTRFFRHPSGFGRRTPPVRSVPPLSLFPSPLVAVEGNDASKIQIESKSRTIHVKFVLQKACLFGEHFFLLGDDPIFGLWDPENAIPLVWSEGHFWTAEMDLPLEKSIHFKFILRGPSGKFHWQPGPDRVLQTWETANTIVVTEDWENAENQKITEEKLTDMVGKVIIPENIEAGNFSSGSSENQLDGIDHAESTEEVIPSESQLHVDMRMNGSNMASNEGDAILVPGLTPIPVSEPFANLPNEVEKGKPNAHYFPNEAENQKITEEKLTDMVGKVIIAENIEAGDFSSGSSETQLDGIDHAESTEEVIPSESQLHVDMRMKESNMASNEGDAILVPGLTPIPVSEPFANLPNEVEKGKPNAHYFPNEAENQKITEEKLTEMVGKVIIAENIEAGNFSSGSSETQLDGIDHAESTDEVIPSESQLHVDMRMNGSNMASNEGDAILVPALTPIPVSEPFANLPNEVEKGKPNAHYFPNEAENGKPLDILFTSEKAEECYSSQDQLSGDGGEAVVSKENQVVEEKITLSGKSIDDPEETSTGVISNVMQWGRKAFQQLLWYLGLGGARPST